MRCRRLIWITLACVALFAPGVLEPGLAQAAPTVVKKRAATQKSSSKKRVSRARVVCRGKGKARKCRRVRGRFMGRLARPEELRKEPLPRPSGWVHVYSINTKEEAKVNIYKEDGSWNQAALARLDEVWRCRRTGEVRAIDPRLYVILSIIYDHYGGRRVELTSGFRFQRNEGSRHFHGAAMDIKVAGVSYKDLYEYATSLDLGGMGIGKYPRSGFVHIDFRAPGEPSYRWTDTSGPGGDDRGHRPSKMWRKRKPTS